MMKKIYLSRCKDKVLNGALFALFLLTALPLFAQTSPTMEVTYETFKRAEGKVGETVLVGKVRIKTTETTKPVTINVAGTNKNMFSVSQSSITAGTQDVEVSINYTPTQANKHSANIQIDCEDVPEAYTMIKVEGIATDPANPPTVTLTPNKVETFNCVAGETSKQVIKVEMKGLADYLYVKQSGTGPFVVSSSQIYKNISTNLTITFKPTKAGEFTKTLTFETYGATPIVIELKGIATAKAEEPQEGDPYALSTANPVSLLREEFDSVTKNQPFHIDGWTNSATVGKRAWWGYTFPDTDASAGVNCAKVTPYDSRVESGKEELCQMFLVTPPLDYKNAASKMFTFRVRGDYLRDGQDDFFKLVYVVMKDGVADVQAIEDIEMPAIQDKSGEWEEYHVDLSTLPLDDVFFMGFFFESYRGPSNSATYYIDNVSFGRTDLPLIKLSQRELALTATLGAETLSEEIKVESMNTAEPIKLKVGGANASKFKTTVSELPANGGSFQVQFNSDVEGVHSAYVKLSSYGAADQYLVISANNKTSTNINTLTINNAMVDVYDLSGRLLKSNININVLDKELVTGTYIISSGDKNIKYTVK